MDNDTNVKTDDVSAVEIDANPEGEKLPDDVNVELTTEVEEAKKVSIENIETVQDVTEPQTDDKEKAARKARLRETRYQRFKVDEDEPVSMAATDQGDEEQEEEQEKQAEPSEKVSSGESIAGKQKKMGNLEESVHTLVEDSDIDFENLFTDDDDDDVDDQERGPPVGDTIKAKTDFLNTLEMPSLSDISEEHDFLAEELIRASRKTTLDQGSVLIDRGRFVNPLTGEYESSSSSKSTKSIESDGDSVKSTDSSLDFDDDLYIDLNPPEKKEEMDMEELLNFQGSLIKDEEQPEDKEAIAAAKHKSEIVKVTIDFLNELFNNVVDEVEYVHADSLLRKQLDKKKLHERLKELVNRYLVEKDINKYLNGKMSDYYKRLRNFRSFANLEAETDKKERARYLEAQKLLDHKSKVAADTKHKNAVLLSSVLMDLAYIQNICMHTEEHLEDIIMRTLSHKSEYLKRVVERELRLMSQKRNEISDTRLYLITRKHTLGRIVDKIVKLETINEDICMDDFISIQNQVVALDKKIEERNNELKRMRCNYHSELHVTQHNREKALALAHKLAISQANLTNLQEKQRQLREKLYAAKLERSNIRKQQSDLTFQGGLLSMPALMFDYDETIEKVITKQANLQELKEVYKRVSNRIMELETRCT